MSLVCSRLDLIGLVESVMLEAALLNSLICGSHHPLRVVLGLDVLHRDLVDVEVLDVEDSISRLFLTRNGARLLTCLMLGRLFDWLLLNSGL